MRLMVTLEERFVRCPDGNYYSNSIFGYSFWQQYLTVFDSVTICARVEHSQEMLDGPRSNGDGVHFFELPMYLGPVQYLAKHLPLKRRMREAASQADAFMLRVPGRISTLLWKELRGRGTPYGVEVVGSIADVFDYMGGHKLFRFLFRKQQVALQKSQCKHAAVASYVTEHYLQETYPTDGWGTHYSSIEMPEEAYLSEAQAKEKQMKLRELLTKTRPFRICHVGTMEVLYKGQGDLLQAVSHCVKQGADLEVVLLGDGRQRAVFEEQATALGIGDRVRFVGKVSGFEKVREYYDDADLVVFPSHTEGLPRVPIEAMARGVTCIGSRVGGIPELIEEELLVPSGNPSAIAHKIMAVLQDVEKLALTVPDRVEKAKAYSLSTLNERRTNCYEKLAAVSRGEVL